MRKNGGGGGQQLNVPWGTLMRINREVLRTLHVANFHIQWGVTKISVIDKKPLKMWPWCPNGRHHESGSARGLSSAVVPHPAASFDLIYQFHSFMDKGSRLYTTGYTSKHKLILCHAGLKWLAANSKKLIKKPGFGWINRNKNIINIYLSRLDQA